MKNIFHNVLIALMAMCLLMTVPALGQPAITYELTWSTINSGGGLINGGEFILTNTIGQPNASWISGGEYELFSGFLADTSTRSADLKNLARLAKQWLEIEGALAGDLYNNSGVDFADSRDFTNKWVYY